MKKKFLIVLFLLFIVVGVVSFAFTRFQKPEQVPQITPVSTIEPLAAPQKFSPDQHILFSYLITPSNLPPSLPIYEVTYTTNYVEKATSLAHIWGLTGSPTSPVKGIYDWIQGNKQFTYDDRTHAVSFSVDSWAGNNPSSIKRVDVFPTLKQTGILSDALSLIESNRTSVSETGEGGRGKILYIYVYKYTLGDSRVPVIFNAIDETGATIQAEKDDLVKSLSFLISPVSVTQKELRQMLTSDQIVEQLNSQKGYLAGIHSNELTYPFPVSTDFSEVQITGVSVAYYLLPGTTSLVPIYVIDGKAIGKEVQKVKYFIRATS